MPTLTPTPSPEPLRGLDLPDGEDVEWAALLADCGLRDQVTGGIQPRIRVIDGDRLLGGRDRQYRPVYCIGRALLPAPTDHPMRAWRLLEYIAYSFFDYRTRETVRGHFHAPPSGAPD